MKKILIKSEEEYRNYVFKILRAMDNPDIWEGFDRTLLDQAFDYMDDLQCNRVVKNRPEAALKYFFEVSKDPKHIEWSELCQALSGAIDNYVHEAFGVIVDHNCYDYDDDGNPINEGGLVMEDDISSPEVLKFEDWVKEFSYPLMIVQYIESGYDRVGDCFICAVDFVELKEFN